VADASGMSLSFGNRSVSGSCLIGVVGSLGFPIVLSELAKPLPNRLAPASLGLGRSSFAVPSGLKVEPSLKPLKLPRPGDCSLGLGPSCDFDGCPKEFLPNDEPCPKAPPDEKLPVVEFSVTVDPKESFAGIPGFCCSNDENGDAWVLVLVAKVENADGPEPAAANGEALVFLSSFDGLPVKLENGEPRGLLSLLPNADGCFIPWPAPSLPTLPNAGVAVLLASALGVPKEPGACAAGLLCSSLGFPKVPNGEGADGFSSPPALAKLPNGEEAGALSAPPAFAKPLNGDGAGALVSSLGLEKPAKGDEADVLPSPLGFAKEAKGDCPLVFPPNAVLY